MSPLIVRADVEVRLGQTLVSPETLQVDDLIIYASARLRRLVPDLDARVAEWATNPKPVTALDPDLVRGAMVSAVVRALDFSRVGRRIKSEEYPEIRTSYTTDKADESGIFFTDAEIDDLAYIPSAGSGAVAFAISMIPVRSVTP